MGSGEIDVVPGDLTGSGGLWPVSSGGFTLSPNEMFQSA